MSRPPPLLSTTPRRASSAPPSCSILCGSCGPRSHAPNGRCNHSRCAMDKLALKTEGTSAARPPGGSAAAGAGRPACRLGRAGWKQRVGLEQIKHSRFIAVLGGWQGLFSSRTDSPPALRFARFQPGVRRPPHSVARAPRRRPPLAQALWVLLWVLAQTFTSITPLSATRDWNTGRGLGSPSLPTCGSGQRQQAAGVSRGAAVVCAGPPRRQHSTLLGARGTVSGAAGSPGAGWASVTPFGEGGIWGQGAGRSQCWIAREGGAVPRAAHATQSSLRCCGCTHLGAPLANLNGKAPGTRGAQASTNTALQAPSTGAACSPARHAMPRAPWPPQTNTLLASSQVPCAREQRNRMLSSPAGRW